MRAQYTGIIYKRARPSPPSPKSPGPRCVREAVRVQGGVARALVVRRQRVAIKNHELRRIKSNTCARVAVAFWGFTP